MAESKRAPRSKTKPAPPPWQPVLAAFWTGFAKPSKIGFLAMVAGFLCSALFAFWFFSQTSLAGSNGDYLPRSARDAEAFATVAALRVGLDRGNDPIILIVGSSTLAQAIGEGHTLARRLAESGFGHWQVRMLTTPLQSPLDQFALLETALQGQTDASPPVLVLLGAGPTRPGWTTERQLSGAYRGRIGLTSSWERAERERLGEKTARLSEISLIDNRTFFILNGTEALLRYVLRSPASQRVDSYAVKTENPEARPRIAASIAALPERIDAYLDQTERLIARMRTRPQVRIAFVEEPLDPGFVAAHGLAGTLDVYHERLTEELRRLGVGYMPILDASGLTSDDYHDILHLRQGSAQTAYQETLAAQLLSVLRTEASQ